MLVLNVTFFLKKAGTAREFYDIVHSKGIDEASRAENGNIKYEFCFPADDDTKIMLLEKWVDTEAHSYHRTLEHYAALEEIKGCYVSDTLVERYTE